jgi:kumamolisin
MKAFNDLFAIAVNKKINVFVASGDNGSTDGISDKKQHVDFPGSSPNVISCRGTTLISDGVTIKNETVWNNKNGNASGGGVSSVFSKPTYQNNITFNKTKRCVPDLAANADPYSGYQIYLDGSFSIVGGTSAVAPLMAGLNARINQAKGTNISFINPNLYSKSVCVDITSGNNGAYTALNGWDACSGKGRLDGTKVITNF